MTPTATLARIRLNPHSQAVARDLRDATQMHRTLMRLVPDNLGTSPRLRSGLLYRVETAPESSIVLLQATAPLDGHGLPPSYGHVEIKDLSPMFAALRPGVAVRYRITVSPCRRERLPLAQKNKRGRIIPLTGADADQWWTRRAEEAGLRLKTCCPLRPRPPADTTTTRLPFAITSSASTAPPSLPNRKHSPMRC